MVCTAGLVFEIQRGFLSARRSLIANLVEPKPRHRSGETLAEMVGTARSRVSHFMKKFRTLGLISYNGHIEVNNSLLSAVLHEKPLLKERD